MKRFLFTPAFALFLFLATTSMAFASGGPGTPKPPQVIVQIKPVIQHYDVPQPLVIALIQIESGFNPDAYGGGCYGLFQLAYPGGEGAAVIRDGYGIGALDNPYLNARYAMPRIAHAWDTLKGSFDAQSLYWWVEFSSLSGHPSLSGNTSDPVVWAFAPKLQYWYDYYVTNPLEVTSP